MYSTECVVRLSITPEMSKTWKHVIGIWAQYNHFRPEEKVVEIE